MFKTLLGERFFFPLFFTLLVTSCFHNDNEWSFQQLATNHPKYNCGRVFYKSSDAFLGLEIELVRSSKGLNGYVNTFSSTIPEAPDRPNYTKITLIVDKDCKNFYVHRLEGGQRLLLTDEATQALLKALQDGQKLTITIPQSPFKARIPVDNFNKIYLKLNDIPVQTPNQTL